MDHKLQEGVEQVQARLLAQLKNIVAGEMSSLMYWKKFLIYFGGKSNAYYVFIY